MQIIIAVYHTSREKVKVEGEYLLQFQTREGVRYLLLDFRMVQGLDASAMLSLTKLEQICSRRGVMLLLSGLRPALERVLQQAQFLPSPTIPVFADLDHGLEWVEDSLLERADGSTQGSPASVGTAEADLAQYSVG